MRSLLCTAVMLTSALLASAASAGDPWIGRTVYAVGAVQLAGGEIKEERLVAYFSPEGPIHVHVHPTSPLVVSSIGRTGVLVTDIDGYEVTYTAQVLRSDAGFTVDLGMRREGEIYLVGRFTVAMTEPSSCRLERFSVFVNGNNKNEAKAESCRVQDGRARP